jgi:Spy/CpxP family protein refolding chaperone
VAGRSNRHVTGLRRRQQSGPPGQTTAIEPAGAQVVGDGFGRVQEDVMKGRSRMFAAVAAGVLMVGSLGLATAMAQQRGPMGPRGMGPDGPWHGGRGRVHGQMGRLGLPLGQLGLTEAQRDQVRAILESRRNEGRAMAEELRAARKALDAAVTAEMVDEGAIRTAHKELSKLLEDGAVQRARVRAEVWNVLTPEQKKRADELKAQAEQRRAQRAERAKLRIEQWMKRRPAPQPPEQM